MAGSTSSRRDFLRQCAAVSTATMLATRMPSSAAQDKPGIDWNAQQEDPALKMIAGEPDLDGVLRLFPRTTGPSAFDPQVIAENVQRLRTTPTVNTGHPLLDLSIMTGLGHIDATFRGDHPKYGVGTYAQDIHDGFPPTIVASVDALSAWGLNRRAAELFRYWLTNFVRDDGTIKYYGPSIAEYGQLLHTAALMQERSGAAGWWQDVFPALDRLAEYLLRLCAVAAQEGSLIAGSPEADTSKAVGKYFHNNAWVVKGLRRWADLCDRQQAAPSTTISTVRKVSGTLAEDTLGAIRRTWPNDPSDWWLPPQIEPLPRPARLTGSWDVASYTNYRYWPELLSSGLLPPDLAQRIVEARLSAGGQFCGMTRFADHLDDWPLADYLYGLWALGRRRDFLWSLYGHVAYHQAEGHLTAYEQVTFPPGKPAADYCLPCQLVAARAGRLLVKS